MEQNETRTLWISISSAIFAVILLYGWAQGKRANLERKFGQTKTVVIAKEDIGEMEIIDETKLDLVEKPSDFVEPAALDNPEEIVGQIALAPIQKGEQVLNTKIVFPGNDTGLSMMVSPGKRAITLPVDDIKGVSKLIQPGDRVDLIAAVDVGSGTTKEKKVRTILQDVPVLAAGDRIVDNLPLKFKRQDEDNVEIYNLRVENNYKNLTVEVKPAEVQLLFHLVSTGAPIYASLRNPNDRYFHPLKTASVNDVLSIPKKRKPTKITKPLPKPKPKKVAPKPKKKGRFESL